MSEATPVERDDTTGNLVEFRDNSEMAKRSAIRGRSRTLGVSGGFPVVPLALNHRLMAATPSGVGPGRWGFPVVSLALNHRLLSMTPYWVKMLPENLGFTLTAAG